MSARRRRILLICGSLNQTTMMHAVGRVLAERCDCSYSPYYDDGLLGRLKPLGVLDHTILAGRFRRVTERYLEAQGLAVDDGGRRGGYDLVLTCSDLVVPRNVRGLPLVLVQEGMTDPDNFGTVLATRLGLPLWLGSTSTTGLSLRYRRFCVASDGYRDHFASRGVPPDRLVVTGIPNYDDITSFLENDFPYRGYVLVATSDTRETFKRDDRDRFLARCVEIAAGRELVFKLHPNEEWERSRAEILRLAPGARVLTEGRAEQMVANCDVLVTQFSTLVFIGLVLGKECHSNFDLAALRRLLPLQNGGASAANIARVAEELLDASARPGDCTPSALPGAA